MRGEYLLSSIGRQDDLPPILSPTAIIPSREFHRRVAGIPAIPHRSCNSFHYWDPFQESTLEIGIVPRNPQENRFARPL